jgi:hypothetical protein
MIEMLTKEEISYKRLKKKPFNKKRIIDTVYIFFYLYICVEKTKLIYFGTCIVNKKLKLLC